MAPFMREGPFESNRDHVCQYNSMERSSGNASMRIAVVGMSCKCPGDATSPEKLWQLCADGRSAWSEVPKSRFNAEAFYHPQGEKPGASNVLGGHFLGEDVSLFDAPFFSFSSEVANSMDPQFRLQLESTFEALENAGFALKDVAGTKTSVFGGSFFHDYYDGMMRDPDGLPRYCLTGNGSAMLSNRVSHFFDLRGPSVTVDTGCSTGLTALHLACQSLRTGDSTMSIVGGANILLNPDNFVAMSCLGFLSPDGKSYSFDSRAKGYGRGEGVATIVIKPLSDALRDGDNVRAVIAGSALNQDGKTPTITSPSQAAQEELIRTCYRDVGLNPKDTCYVEAHGTGTKIGDPVEARAIGSVFSKGRATQNPLYVSSIKTNIGHLEAASGIAAVVKVALILEKGLIPPSINFDMPNPDIDMDFLKIKIPRRLESWPEGQTRRASLNNFGYGGTNSHIIMEAFSSQKSPHVTNSTTSEDWRVFMLSARDESAAKAMNANLKEYLSVQAQDNAVLAKNLAYTLGQHRSVFPWVAATSARSLPELIENLDAKTFVPAYSAKGPRIGFVFNGQGAQWHAMGRELIYAYPIFRSSLEEAERCIKDFGAQWSLTEELMRDEKTSRVNEPMMSLTLCTAIQLCLVRLLVHWGIEPTAVTGHSSGEAGAAYAAGALDFREALSTSYFRGILTAKFQEKLRLRGGMLAVGLGSDEVEPYLSMVPSGKVVLACVNSPSSVTLSGDIEAIEKLETVLLLDNIFARKLKVGAAYHSHHMRPQEDDYMAALQQYLKQNGTFNGVLYSSPVTGSWIQSAKQLGPENWVKNMVQPVLFAQSLRNMCIGSDTKSPEKVIDTLIEIGPHGALSGPIRQTLNLPELKKLSISYGNCLERGKNAVQTMQSLICSLLNKGYPVDMGKVNFPQNDLGLQVIRDLPSYPWNHSVSYWTESRLNKDHRHRRHATHDLLGSLTLGSNPMTPTWRHIIRPSEIPWVRDHVVQSDIVFPAAGYITMAIEAMHQISPSDEQISGYLLRDIAVMNALILSDTTEGNEVQFSLRLGTEDVLSSASRHGFLVESVDTNGKWTKHCRGSISVQMKHSSKHASAWSRQALGPSSQPNTQSKLDTLTKEASPTEVYEIFKSLGIEYGHLFKNLKTIRYGSYQAVSSFSVADVVAKMPSKYQREHVLHPTTLDSIFQASYPSLLESGSELARTMVPTSIKSLFVAQDMCKEVGHRYQASVDLHLYNSRGFEASIATVDESSPSSTPVLAVEGLLCRTIGEVVTKGRSSEDNRICTTMHWDRDLTLMHSEELKDMLLARADPSETTAISDLTRAAFYFIHDALTLLTETDVQNLDWHHKSMYAWMKIEREKAACDKLDTRSSKWFKASDGVKEILYDKVSAKSVNGQMVCRVGKNLVSILRKEVAPLELMLEGKLLYEYYEKALRAPRSYEQTSKIIKLFAHKSPGASVLEIGGGTGGCTLPVLSALSKGGSGETPKFAHYDFTDISAGFFETAREKFAEWGDMISYKKLDIESDPTEQSFEPGSYDLIVACQVLHATKAMENTMTNVRKLLKPGGKLLLIETTRDALDVFLIFGTLPGWWLSEEEERKYSPSLSIDMWNRVLRKTGFSGLDVEVHDCDDEDRYSHSFIMSTATEKFVQETQQEVTIVHVGTPPPDLWTRKLRKSIETITHSVVSVETLHQANIDEKLCIFFDDIDQSVLLQGDSLTFRAIQTLLNKAKGVLWVSFGGAMDCGTPESGAVAGLLRTLRFEDSSKRYVSLDLETSGEAYSADGSRAIVDVFTAIFHRGQGKDILDFEYAQRASTIHIPRFLDSSFDKNTISATTANMVTEPQPFHSPGREVQLEVKTPGFLDSLFFREILPTTEALRKDFVEIETKAFGLNFRDIMVAMGQLDSSTMGFECSGIVTRVGPTASHDLKIGDRVCALMRGNWASFNRVHWTSVSRLPNEMTFETAASIPVIYVTAYYSLYEMARLEKDETVLIHAAAGGVGQAAIALAQLSGAEIFATVGSEEKRDFLVHTYGLRPDHIFFSRDASFAKSVMAATSGKGVDVILNSLSGQLLQETWNCVATLGRFVEIGKRDIELNASLKMAPFTRAASFFAVDLIHLGREKGRLVNRILKDVMRLLDGKKITPISPIKIYPISDIDRAFRVMQAGKHLGKIVITASPDSTVNVFPKHAPVSFAANSSYLIVGGLGGIGRSLARWFVNHGAKNLILLSRSAASQSANFPDLIADLERTGCTVALHNCDITQSRDLARAIEQCQQSMPPIRGVIHGGMVLQDSLFDRMTFENWQAALGPKVQGTQNLHHELLNQPLDFFIMLSSLIGISGHSSQANYAAGSTFQDAFARYRTAKGLPAISVDLGYVKSVGYVSENKGVAERMARMGYRQLEEADVLRILESAIRAPMSASQIITGIGGVEATMQYDIPWRLEPRFSTLNAQVDILGRDSLGDKREGKDGDSKQLKEALRNVFTWPEAVDMVVGAITGKLSDMFMLPETEVDAAKPTSEYGVDSLVAVELRNWLFVKAGAEISIFDMLQSKSLMVLAEKVAGKSTFVREAGVVPAAKQG